MHWFYQSDLSLFLDRLLQLWMNCGFLVSEIFLNFKQNDIIDKVEWRFIDLSKEGWSRCSIRSRIESFHNLSLHFDFTVLVVTFLRQSSHNFVSSNNLSITTKTKTNNSPRQSSWKTTRINFENWFYFSKFQKKTVSQ